MDKLKGYKSIDHVTCLHFAFRVPGWYPAGQKCIQNVYIL